MASFAHFWVLTLFLIVVLRDSQLANSQLYSGERVAEDLPPFLPATKKLLDHFALIGKNSVLDIGQIEMWCVPKDGVPIPQLQANLDYACGHGANCDPIQPGRPCFEPNTVRCHATYAMNSYFQNHGRNLDACSFGGTGIITNKDPSTKNCKYPG